MPMRLRRAARALDPKLAAIAAILALAFVALTIVIAAHPKPFGWERSVELGVQACPCGVFDPFTNTVAALAGIWEVLAGLGVIGCVLIWRRRAAPFALVSVAYSLLYNAFVYAVRRPRPTGVPHTTPTLGAFSYPSGHVGFVMWVCLIGICVFWRPQGRAGRTAAWTAAGIVVIAAGLSRLYIGAHWPADVIGGVLLAGAWLCGSLSIRPLRALLAPPRSG